jgi:LAGLIDADG DNA endonuclease family
MSDGIGIKHGGLLLCTDNFTISDVYRIMNVLIIRYNLQCTIQFYRCYPIIYILAADLPLLKSIVKPYMHSFSMYKLSAGKIKKEKWNKI